MCGSGMRRGRGGIGDGDITVSSRHHPAANAVGVTRRRCSGPSRPRSSRAIANASCAGSAACSVRCHEALRISRTLVAPVPAGVGVGRGEGFRPQGFARLLDPANQSLASSRSTRFSAALP